MTTEKIEVWLVSVDDDRHADANVFATEDDLLAWLWDEYGDHDEKPSDLRRWLDEYAENNGNTVPGNASWTTIRLPLARLKRITE